MQIFTLMRNVLLFAIVSTENHLSNAVLKNSVFIESALIKDVQHSQLFGVTNTLKYFINIMGS